ncbi:hypothetical protein Bca4012_027956 [Brassica carinata]|uniref:Knottins-like domain-containing protein n=1 Tax=Brassica carinata TaxID=52824 RepID=A0A8X7VLC0_BRACI|nr:hypothetical protein Bca52824_024948 [Brassica carinata]
MAKFASIITLLFAALVLFAAFEASALRGGKECMRRSHESQSFSGVCRYDNACMNHCINLEGADDGTCDSHSPTAKCICYFPCAP